MKMKLVLAAFLVVAANSSAWTADCAGLVKELNRLRSEYKEHAAKTGKADASFDNLAEILDKIVKLKAEMRKSECKIPPRK